MSAALQDYCPLCGKTLPREQLNAWALEERPLIRHGTIWNIQAQFPAWSPERGTCPDCWERYRSGFLTRSIDLRGGLTAVCNPDTGRAEPHDDRGTGRSENLVMVVAHET